MLSFQQFDVKGKSTQSRSQNHLNHGSTFHLKHQIIPMEHSKPLFRVFLLFSSNLQNKIVNCWGFELGNLQNKIVNFRGFELGSSEQKVSMLTTLLPPRPMANSVHSFIRKPGSIRTNVKQVKDMAELPCGLRSVLEREISQEPPQVRSQWWKNLPALISLIDQIIEK